MEREDCTRRGDELLVCDRVLSLCDNSLAQCNENSLIKHLAYIIIIIINLTLIKPKAMQVSCKKSKTKENLTSYSYKAG